MESSASLPIFNIVNFDDYNNCMCFEENFYVRRFSEHVRENTFIEKPHGHDFYLMLLITEGSGKHIIDFTEYKVFPGAMFILSPGQVHQWLLSKDVEGYILFFTKDFFLHDFNTERLTRFISLEMISFLPLFSLSMITPAFFIVPNGFLMSCAILDESCPITVSFSFFKLCVRFIMNINRTAIVDSSKKTV